MANITKTQIKKRVQMLIDQLEEIGNLLMELQDDIDCEVSDIEPYEGKDDLTDAQYERQEWLEETSSIIEEQVESISEITSNLEEITLG